MNKNSSPADNQQFPAPQNPALKDEAIRIARAEMERDIYKQAAETSQKAVEHSKWMFTSILTAISIILVLFGLAAYREIKKYEEATAKAEKAAENAHKYEQEAKSIFDSISKQAISTLDGIKKEGEKQVKDLLAKAEAERQINELWNEAFRLFSEGRYEEACYKYPQLIKLKPDMHEAYYNWGTTLAYWAMLKGDENLYEQACQKYEQAIKLILPP